MIAREKIIERSAAEFFEANKAIAGFDNPTRSTYTSVRELVENALDAAEKGGFLPDIEIKIELMPPEEIGDLMGLKDYQRNDWIITNKILNELLTITICNLYQRSVNSLQWSSPIGRLIHAV